MSDQFAPRSVLDELRDELGAQFAALPAPRPVTRAPAWRRATVAVAAVVLVLVGGMLGRSLLEDTYPISLDGLTVEFNDDLNDGLSPTDIERLERRPLSTQIDDPQKAVTVNGVHFTCPIPSEALDLIGEDPCQALAPAPAPLDQSGG